MTAIEVLLIILGFIFVGLSFLISEKSKKEVDLDDIENADELEADYDDFDRYFIVEGSAIKGYQYHELRELLNNGDYYEVKRYIAQKLMEDESAKQIVNLCNEMLEEWNEK